MMLRRDLSDFYDTRDGELFSYYVGVECYVWDEDLEEYELKDWDPDDSEDDILLLDYSITFDDSYEKYLSIMEDEDRIKKSFEKIGVEAYYEGDYSDGKWNLEKHTDKTDSIIDIELRDFERKKLNPIL